MVDGISNAAFGAYTPYGYTQYNDDFLAQSVLNNYTQATTDTTSASKPDTVTFTGNNKNTEEANEEKDSSISTILWTTALVGGAFLAGKYFNKIKGLFKGKNIKQAVTKAQKTLRKAKNKFHDAVTVNKKHKIKNTSVTGAANPVTNEMEARVVQNINTGHVNGSTRRLVEEAAEGTVTPKQQAAYDAEIAYRPMTKKQQKINNANNAKNAAERAEKNAIKNSAKGGENLDEVAQRLVQSEKAAGKIIDGGYQNPFNKNIYYTENGKVTKIVLDSGNKEITDPLKIAKHLDKHNIQIETFATAENKKLNLAA